MKDGANLADFGIACVVGCIFVSGFYFACEMVKSDHPWFALLILLVVACIQVRTGSKGSED